LIVGEVLLMTGVGTAVGATPSLKTATVPDVDRDITVLSGDVAEQSLLLQIVNTTGSTAAPELSVAMTCPR